MSNVRNIWIDIGKIHIFLFDESFDSNRDFVMKSVHKLLSDEFNLFELLTKSLEIFVSSLQHFSQNNYFKTLKMCSNAFGRKSWTTPNNYPEQVQDYSGFLLKINYEITRTLFRTLCPTEEGQLVWIKLCVWYRIWDHCFISLTAGKQQFLESLIKMAVTTSNKDI